ncbi:hypothetical protein ABPG72_008401 [Tetrahymena utriculariae]
MQSPLSKNNKIILASINNKQSAKRSDLINTSSQRTQSNERRLQTLEPDITTYNTNGNNYNNAANKQLIQSPTNILGQSSNQKRKLFSNLNNCTPKSPASIYATINTPSTTTAASISNSTSCRHSKVTKLNNFFESRKYNGVESAKKNRITNENLAENFNRQKLVYGNEMEEESPSFQQGLPLQNSNQANILSINNQQIDLLNRNENLDAEFNKTIKEFRNQIKQNQINSLQIQQQQQKMLLASVPDKTIYLATPSSQNQENYEVTSNQAPVEKQSNSQQQKTGLSSFVTRINKGEMLGAVRQAHSAIGNSNQNIGNSLVSSPNNSNANQNLVNVFFQNQNQQPQQYLSSLVQINNQNQNNAVIPKMNKFANSTEKKTSKEMMLVLNNRFKKADSFKISKTKQEQNVIQENNLKGESVRSSYQKPLSKKSGRQTTSSVRTSSSMKQKSKKTTPLQISLDHSLNQQASNNQTQNTQVQSPQHQRQLTNTALDAMAIEIEEQGQIPSEYPISTLPQHLKINLDDIFLHKQKNSIKQTHYYNVPMINALKNKINSDQYFEQLFKEHFIQSFHSLNFCKSLKPVPHHVLQQKKVNLPIYSHNQGKKTIVFDLDETLIHCNESTDIPADVIIPIKFPNNDIIDAGINIRPFAKECLEELSKHFEIIVFTASHGCYAIKVLQHLDPEEKYISHKLFRESCVQTEEGIHIKDMRIFQNRNIKDIVLIDNAAYSFGFQIENGIPIIPYYDNKNDQELKHLTQYLLNNILDCQDVREINKQYFKMHFHQTSDKIEHAVKKIYNI